MLSRALQMIRQTNRRRQDVRAAQAAVRALPPDLKVSLNIAALRALEAARVAQNTPTR